MYVLCFALLAEIDLKVGLSGEVGMDVCRGMYVDVVGPFGVRFF